ncbi:MAG: cbb3-type cytochrome c oxidase subunit I, partial [Candidatus Riflebacteria bacterium]|nr:cbb3-type cytochrome c oxidase subunit I [Candidatus Riflebacteria bacterium]
PQAEAARAVRDHYKSYFRTGDLRRALPASVLASATDDDLAAMGEFMLWTAWLAVTPRPGETATYSNNWPYAPESGNHMSGGSVIWSAISVVGLLAGLALVLLLWSWLGGSERDEHRTPHWVVSAASLTPSQRRLGKYFLVSAVLLLVQSALGGVLAHQYVTGSDFFGLPLGDWLPFQLARGWHLQLAVFWIATAWVGMGLFIAPILSGKEARWQSVGVDVLFWALVVLVAGSSVGLAATVHGKLGSIWYFLGTTGWEYLELGRIWQVVLAIGLSLWLVLMVRGIGVALSAKSEEGSLARLYLVTSIFIPFFYLFAFAIGRGTHVTVADYWRWWIIHLWVEGIFEVFAVVATGTLLVKMGLIPTATALRSLYLQLILLLGSGVLGTGHHYYWIGATEAWIAVGACFSALEVVPLTLLLGEAVAHYRKSQNGTLSGPYGETFMFLGASAFWNLVGAGLLGFLINLPAVSYFEHGSFLTATHGHGAMMGVFGFLALAVMVFGARHLVDEKDWPRHLFRLSFWGLNVGLAGMIVLTLLPVGIGQVLHAVQAGYDSARSMDFYSIGWVHLLLWLRMIPDTIFIVFGAAPMAYGLYRVWRASFRKVAGDESSSVACRS